MLYGIDLSTAAGRLIANVLASVAAYETEIRGERVKAGQDAAKRRGVKWRGSRKGWTYKVKPEHVAYVRKAQAEGVKIAAIARTTGLSRSSIYRILSRPAA